jgi:hypothetical protein
MNLAEYFAKHRPQAKWTFGERVCGNYNGIPFAGTTGGEGMVNETEGSLVTVFIDLPLKHNDVWHTTYIKVKPKDLKRLPLVEDEVSIKRSKSK